MSTALPPTSGVRLVLLWLACRTLAIGMLLFPGGQYVLADLRLGARWSLALAGGGLAPDGMWQYPPAFSVLLWALGHIGIGLLGLLLIVALSDAAMLLILRGTPGALLWAVAPLLMGPMMLTHFDTAVTLLAVFGLTRATRPLRGGASLGLGAAVKLWPGLLVAATPRDSAAKIGVFAAITYGCFALLEHLLIGGSGFVDNQTSRGLQVESLAAFPFMLAHAAGADVLLEFRFGSTEVATPTADIIARVLLPTAIAITALLGVRNWRQPKNSEEPYRSAGHAFAIVVGLMLSSRVLSPQFNVWVLGVLALSMSAPGRVPRGAVLAVATSCVAAQILYPYAYADFLSGGLLGTSLQAVRLCALALAGWFALRMSAQPNQTPEQIRTGPFTEGPK